MTSGIDALVSPANYIES